MSRFLMSVVLALSFLTASWLGAQTSDFGPAQAYVVQKGDTAAAIARRVYGKSSLGAKLWEVNRNLVAHPDKLTAGDTIYLFPEAALLAGKTITVPPPPLDEPVGLYDRGRMFSGSFPKYFNFLADGRGLGESGSVRVALKRADPVSGQTIEELYEVRNVGRILASDQHNGIFRGEAADKVRDFGKTLLSANDNVVLLFTEDLAKILDSDTYGDSDPYFREFPVYGRPGQGSRAPVGRTDEGQNLGELYIFKGLVTVVARVEGLAPTTPRASEALKKGKSEMSLEPVSYVGRITYSEDVVELTDQVFCFVPLNPGPERVLDTPALEAPDSYVPLN